MDLGQLVVDLGRARTVVSLGLCNPLAKANAGTKGFRVFVSVDMSHWQLQIAGNLTRTCDVAASHMQWFSLGPVTARYLRLHIDSSHGQLAGLNHLQVMVPAELERWRSQ